MIAKGTKGKSGMRGINRKKMIENDQWASKTIREGSAISQNYVCEEIREGYRWKGMTTPGLLFEDLPMHNSYDQFPYLRTY